MKTLTLKLLPAAIIALALAGCNFHNEQEQAEYDRVYKAANEVLSKYFNVKESQFLEGHLIAYSKVSNQFGEQQRYKVDCWVGRDDEGFFHPHVQVLEEMNMAIVDPSRNSHGQEDSKWREVGFNTKLETQLLNEIGDRTGSDSPGVNADWYNTDLQLIERQKKIDAARAGYQQMESPGAPASGPGPVAPGGPQTHSTPGAK